MDATKLTNPSSNIEDSRGLLPTLYYGAMSVPNIFERMYQKGLWPAPPAQVTQEPLAMQAGYNSIGTPGADPQLLARLLLTK
jgi:hypothetical protein